MPSGWPSAIAPPFGFTRASSSARPSVAQHRERLRGERFVELDDVDLRRAPGRRARAACCVAGTGPDAHDARRDAGGRHSRPHVRAASGRSALPRLARRTSSAHAPSLTPEALPAVTVPSLRNDGLQLGQRLERGVARGCSSRSTTTGRPCFCAIVTGEISSAKTPALLRRDRLLLAAQREAVLILARDLELLGDVLGRSPASSRRRTAPSSAG